MRSDQTANLAERVQPYTMMPRARLEALAHLTRGRPGVLVQCGAYSGGSAALIAAAMPADEVWLFDSLQGLPAPRSEDGEKARRKFNAISRGQRCRGDVHKVREVFSLVLPDSKAGIKGDPALHIIVGWVHDTLLATNAPAPDVIVGWVHDTLLATNASAPDVLRIVDVGFYEATLLILRHFVPRMRSGRLVIVDDYGHWRGAKLACDQFFTRPGQGFDHIPGDPTRYWFV